MPRRSIAAEVLVDLRRQLGALPPRSAERHRLVQEAASFYGVSEPTLYRLLRQRRQPHSVGRADRGAPRVLPQTELERYLELIAALKVRPPIAKADISRRPKPFVCLKITVLIPLKDTCKPPKGCSRSLR